MSTHPPVPPLWVALLVVVVGLYAMIHRVNKACIRWEYIHWTAHAKQSLVAKELDCIWNDTGVMRFSDPDAIVPNIFTLESLDLQRRGCVEVHGTSSGDARDLLKDSSEERVARTREAGETNSLVID